MNTAPMWTSSRTRGRRDGPGLTAAARGRGRRHPHQPRRRRRVACSPGARARRCRPCSTSSAPRSAATQRRDARLVVDCKGYPPRQGRRAAPDGRRSSPRRRSPRGLAQEMGPLNPYERRIVHMAVAEVESVTSESIGDAFEKTVIISVEVATLRRRREHGVLHRRHRSWRWPRPPAGAASRWRGSAARRLHDRSRAGRAHAAARSRAARHPPRLHRLDVADDGAAHLLPGAALLHRRGRGRDLDPRQSGGAGRGPRRGDRRGARRRGPASSRCGRS